MTLKIFKPITPGSRNKSKIDTSKISKSLQKAKNLKPLKSQTYGWFSSQGRNTRGIITTRHRGGGHKRLYRKIEFTRAKIGVLGYVSEIEYDPNRTADIARIFYTDGSKNYIIHPQGLKKKSSIIASPKAPIALGNSLPLRNIPLGTEVHNIELHPGKGGQIARAAGTSAFISFKKGARVTLKLSSGNYRHFEDTCWATIGKVSNIEHYSINLGKAGCSRWLSKRPSVRGSAKNAVDHPHGGGEGKASIGRVPSTPWGKPALGVKTRARKKWSDRFFQGLRKK